MILKRVVETHKEVIIKCFNKEQSDIFRAICQAININWYSRHKALDLDYWETRFIHGTIIYMISRGSLLCSSDEEEIIRRRHPKAPVFCIDDFFEYDQYFPIRTGVLIDFMCESD